MKKLAITLCVLLLISITQSSFIPSCENGADNIWCSAKKEFENNQNEFYTKLYYLSLYLGIIFATLLFWMIPVSKKFKLLIMIGIIAIIVFLFPNTSEKFVKKQLKNYNLL